MSDALEVLQVDGFVVECLGSGPLLPWLGPAFRGAVAHQLKDRVCLQPPRRRRRDWRHCDGCEHAPECTYARSFEPVHVAAGRFRGQSEAVRPVVVAPYYPVPDHAVPGLRIPVRITVIGADSGQACSEVLRALTAAGKTAGLGQSQVRFRALGSFFRQSLRIRPEDLPASADALPGTVPRLGVGLTAPLFLSRRQPRDGETETETGRKRKTATTRSSKRTVVVPRFDDLFRAALRTLANLFASYAEPLHVDFAGLKRAAEQVRMVDHCYEPFQQVKYSSRTRQRFLLRGCVGGGVYADVPMALIPWMLWGGRLHVGTHRVAGAGSWRLVMD